MARPAPVLPEVGSTIVPPGFSRPSRSAASIIASPIRSFTEPPGFRYSSFARIVPGTSAEIRSSRTIGVDPTRSSTLGNSRAIAAEPTSSAPDARAPCPSRPPVVAPPPRVGSAFPPPSAMTIPANLSRICDGTVPTSCLSVSGRLALYSTSVPEVPAPGEDHRRARGLHRGDHLVVARRAARLDQRRDARLEGELRPVREREERVAGEHPARRLVAEFARLLE